MSREPKTAKCGCFYVGAVQLCSLHAAAPELLEACKVLADQVHDDVPHAYERVHAALGAVQDAIAKAGAK